MEEIHDIHGLRLVVEKEEDCYRALSVVHKLWPQVTERFKDYISRPKLNGYAMLAQYPAHSIHFFFWQVLALIGLL